MRIKVTLDTNVIISSIKWPGNPYLVLHKIIEGEIDLVMSYNQFDELYRVLNYDKFQFSFEQKYVTKSIILDTAIFVTPREKIDLLTKDPSDNMILECAVEGKADYIVTGDRALLELKHFRGIRMLTPRQFLELAD